MNSRDPDGREDGVPVSGCEDGEPWAGIRIPLLRADGWFGGRVRSGLRELERIRRETDAAMAALLGSMSESRDAVAGIARVCGVSGREARRRRDVAKVCGRIPEAAQLLGSGIISSEHVGLLAHVCDRTGVESLLADARVQSPDEFADTVERFRLAGDAGEDVVKRHRAQRSFRFRDGPDGMVGVRGLLPPVEGLALKAALDAVVDATWRREHPERAETLGGHGGESREQRMADALLEIAGVRPFYGLDDAGSTPGAPGATTGAPGTTVRTGKPAVVIVFNVDAWRADLLGHGPVPVEASLFDQTRAELYYLFETMHGEVLKLGRARKEPTPLQRLAVIARDRHCIYPGCHAPPDRSDVHHCDEWERDAGTTDVDVLGLLCRAHHRHLHVHGEVVARGGDGTVTIRQREPGPVAEAA